MMLKKLFCSAFLIMTAMTAMAGDEPVVTDSSRVYDLDEVIVVSQAKEFFRLRQQPISATVLGTTELNSLGVNDLREISDYVPSFVMPNYGSRFTSSIYVRGIGSRVNSPSMGVYVDDMPLMSKTAFNSHTYQLERVDVLRGPQGTLYGMNTEGGMVRMYTRNPLFYQGTDINLGIGTGFYRNAEVAHHNKVNDQLAFSLAAFYTGQDGFFKNTLTDEQADNGDEAGGRFKLVWMPTSRLTVNYVADYQFAKQKAYPYGVLNIDDNSVGKPNQDHQSKYKRNMFNTGLGLQYQANGFDFFSNTSYQYLYDNLLMDNDYSDIDFIVVDQNQLQNALTQEFTVKSNNNSRWHWTTGLFLSQSWLKTTAPNTFGSAFSTMMSNQVGGMIYSQMLNAMAARMGQEAAAAMIAAAGGVNIDMSLFVPCLFRTPQFNMGLFHESTFNLTEQLRLTLGLRYDYTHSKIEYNTSGDATLNFDIMGAKANTTILSPFEHTNKAYFNQLLPKLGLTYTLNNGSNFYGTVTKGYRAGGFNVQMFGDIIQNDVVANMQSVMTEAQALAQAAARNGQTEPVTLDKVINHTEEQYDQLLEGIQFKPEESWNFELGSHLNLFGNSLHADIALFYMMIRNQQLSVFTEDYGYGRKMVNAGKSYSCGVELSLNGSALNDHLTWMASYAYNHAAFKDYTTKESSRSDNIIDYKDKRVPYVPEHTLAAMLDYRFDINKGILNSLTLGANVNGMGNIYWDEANTFSQKFYAVAGAHLAADMGLVNVNIWARNITDTKYNTFAFLSKATGAPVYSAQRGNPFQMGVDIRLHF